MAASAPVFTNAFISQVSTVTNNIAIFVSWILIYDTKALMSWGWDADVNVFILTTEVSVRSLQT